MSGREGYGLLAKFCALSSFNLNSKLSAAKPLAAHAHVGGGISGHGISKGLAYNYFKSKNDLAEAIVDLIHSLFSQYEIMFVEIKDPYKLIETMIKVTFEQLKNNTEFWKLWTSFAMQHEITEKMGKLFEEIEKKFLMKMESVFRKIGIKIPKAEAYLLRAMFDGISIDYLISKEKYPLKSVERLLLKKYSKEKLEKLK